jgi:hypothetical protein
MRRIAGTIRRAANPPAPGATNSSMNPRGRSRRTAAASRRSEHAVAKAMRIAEPPPCSEVVLVR